MANLTGGLNDSEVSGKFWLNRENTQPQWVQQRA